MENGLEKGQGRDKGMGKGSGGVNLTLRHLFSPLLAKPLCKTPNSNPVTSVLHVTRTMLL